MIFVYELDEFGFGDIVEPTRCCLSACVLRGTDENEVVVFEVTVYFLPAW